MVFNTGNEEKTKNLDTGSHMLRNRNGIKTDVEQEWGRTKKLIRQEGQMFFVGSH